jgi:two-component system LytT family response regulator
MEKPITAIIIDDEQEACDLLENLLDKHPEIIVIGAVNSVDEGVRCFVENQPDIVFLDVQMPQKNGFEFLHEINEFNIETTIIFVTAYHEFAIEAIRHAAFDYLLKPINQIELKKAILRYQNKTNAESFKKNIPELLENIKGLNKIQLNTRTGYKFLDPDDIIYLQADGNYCIIHLKTSNFISTLNLGKVEEIIPTNYFLRISRSLIINKKYLTSVDRKKRTCLIEFNDEKILLEIAKSFLKQLKF